MLLIHEAIYCLLKPAKLLVCTQMVVRVVWGRGLSRIEIRGKCWDNLFDPTHMEFALCVVSAFAQELSAFEDQTNTVE